ncbi:FAD/NAD(P)-binding domain-containing protein [Auricularia subglabra TFB-10046 SS5]|nr:FAD/NAD(P)-binding domain-containing protein [Auricularia subglabra TFB-10046 SS5]
MPSNQVSPLRIAIIGGGVGGLCLAGTIAKFDAGNLEVALYEAAPDFADVGAGLSIYGRSFDIVAELGLQEEFAAIDETQGNHKQIEAITRRSDKGPIGYEFARTPFGGRGAVYHRADLRSVFARNCERSSKTQISFNKRLASFSPISEIGGEDGYELIFTDGTTATCDVVIGADGVRSPVRARMFDLAATQVADDSLREFGPPLWSGQNVYRTLIPMNRATEEWNKLGGEGDHPVMNGVHQYSGVNKKVIAYAIQGRTIANVAFFVRHGKYESPAYEDDKWVRNVEPDEVRKDFEEWETSVIALTKGITKVSCWAVHVTRKLPYFARGRVALLGDAAHAMMTHNAAGANQALEDAYILGRILTHPSTTRSTVHLALQAYDRARRPRAQEMVEISSDQGRLTDFTAPEGDDEAAVAAKMWANAASTAEGTVVEELQVAETTLARLIEQSK